MRTHLSHYLNLNDCQMRTFRTEDKKKISIASIYADIVVHSVCWSLALSGSCSPSGNRLRQSMHAYLTLHNYLFMRPFMRPDALHWCSRQFTPYSAIWKFNHVWCRASWTYLDVHIISSRSSALRALCTISKAIFQILFCVCAGRARDNESGRERGRETDRDAGFSHRIPQSA